MAIARSRPADYLCVMRNEPEPAPKYSLSCEASVELDVELIRRAQAQGIDVRAVAEKALRVLLREPSDRDKELMEVRIAMEQYAAYVDEHGSFADEWRSF